VRLELSTDVANILSDVIDFYLAGSEEAEHDVELDHIHPSAEAMLRCTSDMRQTRIEMIVLQEQIRTQLEEGA